MEFKTKYEQPTTTTSSTTSAIEQPLSSTTTATTTTSTITAPGGEPIISTPLVEAVLEQQREREAKQKVFMRSFLCYINRHQTNTQRHRQNCWQDKNKGNNEERKENVHDHAEEIVGETKTKLRIITPPTTPTQKTINNNNKIKIN